MKKVLYVMLVLALAFSLTACDKATEAIGDAVGSALVEGTIDETAVICDNDDVKITFESASYDIVEEGILAYLNVENKTEQDVSVGFFSAFINGVGFDAWQADEVVEAGLTRGVTFKLVSDVNLNMANITKLSELLLDPYYYLGDDDYQALDSVLVKNSKNPDYQQTVNFSGKELTIDFGQGTLKMTFGVDNLVKDEEYNQTEIYAFSQNMSDVPIIIYYEATMNDGNNPELPYCGPVLYEKESYMEALPFDGGDADKFEGLTIKNLYITDFEDNELFRLDELYIAKDDLEPASY